MPQLRPYKWTALLLGALVIIIMTLYFFNQVYLPRILAVTRIRTYFRDLKVQIITKSVLIIAIVLVLLMSVSLIFSGSGRRSLDKLSGYECGLEPMGDAKVKLKILYYILGVLYLLFDLEIVFLYPQASSLWLINNYLGSCCVIAFVFQLTLTFIYEWFMGVLSCK